MEKKRELLEYLAEEAGCNYLSDLRCGANFHFLQRLLQVQIQPEDYPLKEWNEAACYITGQTVDFVTAEEAYRFLLKRLEETADGSSTLL